MNRTVLRTVEILEIISKHGEISLADLVKITGYPKTSVYDILHALDVGVISADDLWRNDIGMGTGKSLFQNISLYIL